MEDSASKAIFFYTECNLPNCGLLKAVYFSLSVGHKYDYIRKFID